MHDDYFLMYSPEDFGSFVNNLECASFAIWDDSENPDLKDWVENFDFEAVSFTEPTGMVFGGVMDFVESPKDFGLEYIVCFSPSPRHEVKGRDCTRQSRMPVEQEQTNTRAGRRRPSGLKPENQYQIQAEGQLR